MPQINPNQIQMIKQMLSKNGVTAEQMVRQICQQRGYDVNEFLRVNGLK